MGISYDDFLDTVRERALLSDRASAERASGATLSVLGQTLPGNAVRLAATDLPNELATLLEQGPHDGTMTARELFERIATREGTTVGFAREHAQVVCEALLPFWSDDTRALLRADLPADIAVLFAPRPDEGRPVPRRAGHPEPPRSLAQGKPGGVRPLSEASPDKPHEHSVSAENPHGNLKLSSARGISTEREHTTLATGHGGSDRPVSESED